MGNRSHVYQKQAEYENALIDADAAIALRRDWAKGYFRKGLSLHGMGKHEEAFKTFYECLTIEMVCGSVDAKSTYPSLMECAKQLYCVIDQTVKSRFHLKPAPSLNLRPNESWKQSLCSSPRLFTIGKSSPAKHGSSYAPPDRVSSFSQLNLSTPSVSDDEGLSTDSERFNDLFWVEDTGNVTKTIASNDVTLFIPDVMKGLVEFVRTMYENSEKLEVISKPEEEWYIRGLLSYRAQYRPIDSTAVDATDYECPLCMRLLWQPITTPCGHTFCRVCLDRALDHNSVCPMCKSAEVKKVYLVERLEFVPNEFIESSMRRLLPIEYQERKMLQQQEITEFGGGTENANIIPIFVCTVSLPGIPCPLHVFEPRYRLMVRRAMESGTREFGMSCQIDESP